VLGLGYAGMYHWARFGVTADPGGFGDNTALRIDSERVPGVWRAFPSFSRDVLVVNDARVFAGIHYRTSCLDGNNVGRAVARFVLGHSMRPESEEGGHD